MPESNATTTQTPAEEKIEQAEKISVEIKELLEACENSDAELSDSFLDGLDHARKELEITASQERELGQHRQPLKAVEGMESVTIECAVSAQGLEECNGWKTDFELKEPAYYEDGQIHLPGFAWECPECGNPHNFKIEGIHVSNLVRN